MPRVDYQKLSGARTGETSEVIRARVEAAREKQIERFKGTKLMNNADMTPTEIRQFCQLEEPAEKLMQTAMRQLRLTARGYHRVLKLGRTIADLAGSDNLLPEHLAEALQYRSRETEI